MHSGTPSFQKKTIALTPSSFFFFFEHRYFSVGEQAEKSLCGSVEEVRIVSLK